jgi:hypothetical protein
MLTHFFDPHIILLSQQVKADLDFAHYTHAGIDMFLRKKSSFRGQNPPPPPDTHTDVASPDVPQPQRQAAMFKIHDIPIGYEFSVPSDVPIVRCLKQAAVVEGGGDTSKESNSIVGFTTSGSFGPETRATIALGYLTDISAITDADDSDHELVVNLYGHPCRVTVLPGPPVRVNPDQQVPAHVRPVVDL